MIESLEQRSVSAGNDGEQAEAYRPRRIGCCRSGGRASVAKEGLRISRPSQEPARIQMGEMSAECPPKENELVVKWCDRDVV